MKTTQSKLAYHRILLQKFPAPICKNVEFCYFCQKTDHGCVSREFDREGGWSALYVEQNFHGVVLREEEGYTITSPNTSIQNFGDSHFVQCSFKVWKLGL